MRDGADRIVSIGISGEEVGLKVEVDVIGDVDNDVDVSGED